MIITSDWKNTTTLRLNFNYPVGLASNGFNFDEDIELFDHKFKSIDCETLLKVVNDFITNYFITIEDINIDWRDCYEVELNIDKNIELSVESFIEQLEEFIDEYAN